MHFTHPELHGLSCPYDVDIDLSTDDFFAGVLHNVLSGIRSGVANFNYGADRQNTWIRSQGSTFFSNALRFGLAGNGVSRCHKWGPFGAGKGVALCNDQERDDSDNAKETAN